MTVSKYDILYNDPYPGGRGQFSLTDKSLADS